MAMSSSSSSSLWVLAKWIEVNRSGGSHRYWEWLGQSNACMDWSMYGLCQFDRHVLDHRSRDFIYVAPFAQRTLPSFDFADENENENENEHHGDDNDDDDNINSKMPFVLWANKNRAPHSRSHECLESDLHTIR